MTRLGLRTAAVAAALALGLGSALFASGQKEGVPPSASGAAAGSQKITTLTGTISYENLIHPVLKSGATEVELLVPRFAVYESGVKEGQSVTVKGYRVDASQLGPRHELANNGRNATYFFVTAAVIDGKEYNVWDARPGYGPGRAYGPGYGPRGGWGMMGPYGGRGYGMMGYGPAGPMGFYGGPGFRGGYGPGMWYRWNQGDPQGQPSAPGTGSNQ